MSIVQKLQRLKAKSKYSVKIVAATMALCAGGLPAAAAPIGTTSPIAFADPQIFFGQMPSGFAFGDYIDASITQTDADEVSLVFSFLADLGGEFSFVSLYFPQSTELASLSGGVISQDFRMPASAGTAVQNLTGASFAKTATMGFTAGDELAFTLAATGASADDWNSFAIKDAASGHYGLTAWSNAAGINTAVSGLSGNSAQLAPVPLPLSGALLFAGILGLAGLRKGQVGTRKQHG